MNAWSSFTQLHFPTTKEYILKSSLWFNSHVKVGKKCIYYKHWESAGVSFIGDLFCDRSDFLSFNNFKIKFKVRTNFIEYGAVVKAIKSSFQELLNNDVNAIPRPFIPFNFYYILRDTKGSRRIYDTLTSTRKVVCTFITKWEDKLNINYDLSTWSQFFEVPFKCTVDTKLRWFQFIIIHRLLGSNSFLYKISKSNSDLCTFCKSEVETLLHLFCGCTITVSFWNSVFIWVEEKTDLRYTVNNELLLFGKTETQWKNLNHFLLICRFHVYKMKMNEKCPYLPLLKNDFRKYFIAEKCMYALNGNITKFFSKWAISLHCATTNVF